jgi:hypothetical protein
LKGGGEVSLTFEFPGHQARISQGRHRQGEEEEAAGALEGAAEQARDPRDRQGRKQNDRARNIEAQLLGPAYLRGMVSHSTFNPSLSLSQPSISLSLSPTNRCKKHEVPIEKIFNKTQRDKFRWAIEMADEDYEF